jgi:hypothetical protein
MQNPILTVLTKLKNSYNTYINNDVEMLVEIYKKICFLEAVKCSPYNTEQSKPFDSMYKTCYKIFLLNEMPILSPKNIIIFDKRISKAIKDEYPAKNI